MDGARRGSELVEILAGLGRVVRPWQWYKQGVMFIGIVFSKNLLAVAAWTDLLVGVGAFTTFAGAAYIFNDINDVEEDRNHPRKRHRPIASGQVSAPVAGTFGLVLVVAGITAAYSLGTVFLTVLLGYISMNALYSLYFKHVLFADVIIVALGFVLRAVAGVVAIDVVLSPWLIVSTFLLALVLALGKRRHELATVSDSAESRRILESYAEQHLDHLLVVTMATLLMSYTLYTFSGTDSTMLVTLPFAFFGVFRYHYLIHTTEIAGRPQRVVTDAPSMVNLGLWLTCIVAALYDFHEYVLGVLS